MFLKDNPKKDEIIQSLDKKTLFTYNCDSINRQVQFMICTCITSSLSKFKCKLHFQQIY